MLWPNSWLDQDATWYRGRAQPRRHCVRWGPRSSSQNGDRAPPQFSAHVYCGHRAGWIKMPLGMVWCGSSHIVLNGKPALLPKNGAHTQFSAHVCCGQTAGWIKMPLGTMVDLGTGNIVLDADPAPPPPKGYSPPIFGPSLLCQTAGWIKMPLGTRVGLGSGHIVLHVDPAPPARQAAQSLQF